MSHDSVSIALYVFPPAVSVSVAVVRQIERREGRKGPLETDKGAREWGAQIPSPLQTNERASGERASVLSHFVTDERASELQVI